MVSHVGRIVHGVCIDMETRLIACFVTGAQFILEGVANTISMSEIKHEPCNPCAQCLGEVHDFQRCAPGLCTLFQPFIITNTTC